MIYFDYLTSQNPPEAGAVITLKHNGLYDTGNYLHSPLLLFPLLPSFPSSHIFFCIHSPHYKGNLRQPYFIRERHDIDWKDVLKSEKEKNERIEEQYPS